jgi:Escherichia/Staphylococcus phage prohead protease
MTRTMTTTELDQRAQLDALMGRVEFRTTDTAMRTKLLATIDAQVEQEGTFSALVAAFGNVDRGKDRIMPGAFTKSLEDWRASGRRIPVIWHHLATDPSMIIGSADPALSHETPEGLVLVGRLNVERSAAAGQIRDLLKNGDVSGWSFGYNVKRRRAAPGGVTELLELDILEAGPTPMPMNTAARTLSVKGEQVPEPDKQPSHTEVETMLIEEGIVAPIVGYDELRAAAREHMAHILSSNGNGEERKAWTPPPSTYSDAAWQRACLIDYADGNDAWLGAPTKARYAMPVRTPNGTIDKDALTRAAVTLPQTPLNAEVKRAAATRLIRAHEEANVPVHNRWLLALADKSLATKTKASPIHVAEFRC